MPNCPDLQKMRQRVREKSVSYDRYNFTSHFDDFLKAFFDLAQEYDSLNDFYRICVAVPMEMIGVSSALYLYEEKERELYLVCDCTHGIYKDRSLAPKNVVLSREPYRTGDCYLMPIYSKAPLDLTSYEDSDDGKVKEGKPSQCLKPDYMYGANRVLGMYSVSPFQDLSRSDRFFFTKYTNRIGYNLHNRMVARQNIEHLKFINTLVMDIEHNVIVPNMYFRYLFNKLRKDITELEGLYNQVSSADSEGEKDTWLTQCKTLQNSLFLHHDELVKHHANISLFLESLFRREHFESGHLVLHPKRCFVEKDIILPQIEHYASRFCSANITIERPGNMLDEEFQLLVDIGLLSQVYANLFSNAVKYARES
ncbi:MAG: sensor histidine kinase, partial [Candidatus Electrothrix sp. AR3]|nr:sensor histidine kinase [Candidatus Electrothrix sp. AR3]